jgi:hypothetical protein
LAFWLEERGGVAFLYCNESFKRLTIPTALAEMLSCKLLSIVAAGKKLLYFT